MLQVSGFLQVLWFPQPIKLDCHDIAEILLKVALNTITLINNYRYIFTLSNVFYVLIKFFLYKDYHFCSDNIYIQIFVFRSKPKQSNQGERSTWSGDATRNVEFGMSESTVTITVDEEKKKETAREQPVWMKESTIEGASNDTINFVIALVIFIVFKIQYHPFDMTLNAYYMYH